VRTTDTAQRPLLPNYQLQMSHVHATYLAPLNVPLGWAHVPYHQAAWVPPRPTILNAGTPDDFLSLTPSMATT